MRKRSYASLQAQKQRCSRIWARMRRLRYRKAARSAHILLERLSCRNQHWLAIHEEQEDTQEQKSAPRRRRGYQLMTTGQLPKAMQVAGLHISEVESGYDWLIADTALAGHATTAINAVANAISYLRQEQ